NGGQGPVLSLAFSADGRLLACGGANTTVLVWRLPALALPTRPGGDPEALWRDLADADPARAYRAVLALAAAPGRAVPLIKERLKPRPAADPRRVARLVADLDSDEFEVREKASEELATLGPGAEAALRKALAGEVSAEVRSRVEDLLAGLEKGSAARERLRDLRAVEVLERAGTPAAREL